VLPESFGERAGTEVTFSVLVWDVKAKRLPTVDDEFARTASEFDTVAELREDVRSKLRELKQSQSRSIVRDLALQRLLDLVDVDLPERLVDEETEDRVESAKERAERAGTTLDAVLAERGWDELRLRSDARAHAVRALRADLALEAVARQEGIEATPQELDAEVRGLARASGRDPKEVRRILERSGQVRSLAGDIIRTKALDLVVDAAEVTIEGAPATSEPDPSPTEEGGRD
jgi:trigger factor